EGVIGTGASGMLRLFERKGVLPRTLPVLAALGDDEGVRALVADADAAAANAALMSACRFRHKAIAARLLERCIAFDDELGRHIDRWQGRAAFVDYLCEHFPGMARATPWRAFVVRQLVDAVDADNLPAYVGWLER